MAPSRRVAGPLSGLETRQVYLQESPGSLRVSLSHYSLYLIMIYVHLGPNWTLLSLKLRPTNPSQVLNIVPVLQWNGSLRGVVPDSIPVSFLITSMCSPRRRRKWLTKWGVNIGYGCLASGTVIRPIGNSRYAFSLGQPLEVLHPPLNFICTEPTYPAYWYRR